MKSIENILKVVSNTNTLPQVLQIFKIMNYMIAGIVEVTYEHFLIVFLSSSRVTYFGVTYTYIHHVPVNRLACISVHIYRQSSRKVS